MDTELVKEEANRTTKPPTNGFIPKLMGKKVIIRLTSGGQLSAHKPVIIEPMQGVSVRPSDNYHLC